MQPDTEIPGTRPACSMITNVLDATMHYSSMRHVQFFKNSMRICLNDFKDFLEEK